jgi:hypothetical protein
MAADTQTQQKSKPKSKGKSSARKRARPTAKTGQTSHGATPGPGFTENFRGYKNTFAQYLAGHRGEDMSQVLAFDIAIWGENYERQQNRGRSTGQGGAAATPVTPEVEQPAVERRTPQKAQAQKQKTMAAGGGGA